MRGTGSESASNKLQTVTVSESASSSVTKESRSTTKTSKRKNRKKSPGIPTERCKGPNDSKASPGKLNEEVSNASVAPRDYDRKKRHVPSRVPVECDKRPTTLVGKQDKVPEAKTTAPPDVLSLLDKK